MVTNYISHLLEANFNAPTLNKGRQKGAYMTTFHAYVKKTKNDVVPAITIIDLIPFGKENAISRKRLLQECITKGLVEDTISDPDRKMRQLIEKARIDYVILNCSDGAGYYRPNKEDILELQKYIRQEDNRGKQTFRNLKLAKRLYEDYKHERFD